MGVFNLFITGAKSATGAKKAAPFFSRVDEALENLKREKGTPEEFLREIEKQPGVKKAEIEDRGLKKAVAAKAKDSKKPITKETMRKILQESPPPRVQEKVLTSDVPDYDDFLEAKAQELYGVDYFDLSGAEKATIKKMFDEIPATQYDRYKTPGGENYREILLKLPSFDSKRIMELEADIRRSEGAYRDPMSMPHFRAMVEELQQLKAQQAKAGPEYASSHWQGEPNVLAHIRVQDFKTPEGKKVLLVDEIQSDWHQEGRKKGYKGQESAKVTDEEYKRGVELQQRNVRGEPLTEQERLEMDDILQRHAESLPGMRVPDAPFKKNWHELAMKRVLDYAAENGYDTVAITPGIKQAERYDLSKQLDKVLYSPYGDGTFEVSAVLPNGQEFGQVAGRKTLEEIENTFGKEIAQKMAKGEKTGEESGVNILSGEGLQVGGEGMKGFYDKILPDYLSNFGKPYGASVGQMDLVTHPSKIEKAGSSYYQTAQRTMPVHTFDITPQLREQIKTKGLPLYSRIGMGPEGLAAGTGAATIGATQEPEQPEQQVQNPVHFTENPDAMRLELMQRN